MVGSETRTLKLAVISACALESRVWNRSPGYYRIVRPKCELLRGCCERPSASSRWGFVAGLAPERRPHW